MVAAGDSLETQVPEAGPGAPAPGSCEDGEGCCVAGVSAVVVAGLQPVVQMLVAREVRATKAIADKLGDTRAWFTWSILVGLVA